MICSPDSLRRECLQADVLHLAAIVLDRDRVSDDEWLVHHDRDRGEEIAEDVLDRERDGKTADPESGEERPDLDVER